MNQEIEFKQFSVRVPVELFQKITSEANEHKRSRSAQVLVVLEKHYDERLEEHAEPKKDN